MAEERRRGRPKISPLNRQEQLREAQRRRREKRKLESEKLAAYITNVRNLATCTHYITNKVTRKALQGLSIVLNKSEDDVIEEAIRHYAKHINLTHGVTKKR